MRNLWIAVVGIAACRGGHQESAPAQPARSGGSGGEIASVSDASIDAAPVLSASEREALVAAIAEAERLHDVELARKTVSDGLAAAPSDPELSAARERIEALAKSIVGGRWARDTTSEELRISVPAVRDRTFEYMDPGITMLVVACVKHKPTIYFERKPADSWALQTPDGFVGVGARPPESKTNNTIDEIVRVSERLSTKPFKVRWGRNERHTKVVLPTPERWLADMAAAEVLQLELQPLYSMHTSIGFDIRGADKVRDLIAAECH